VTAGLVAVLGLFLYLRGFYRHELYHFTGDAEWIWVTDEVGRPRPTAALFIKSFDLADRPRRAVAKVCGDRQYVLWINGQPAMAGRNRPRFFLDVVPVTDLLTAGRNVVAAEVRSRTSVGALLFALDLDPSEEGRRAGDPAGRNVIVSDGSWGVTETWTAGAPDAPPGDLARPWVWGRPPDHPWSYPTPVLHDRPLIQAAVGEARHLGPADFHPEGADRWACDLGGAFGGLLWVETGAAGTGARVMAGPAPRTGDTAAGVEVITLLGERRWLFPGRFEGDRLVIAAADPPRGVDLQPTLETTVR